MEPEQKTNGALIGSIVIIVILIIGGVYLWKNNMGQKPLPPDSNLSGSDNTSDMEASLNSMDLDGLDSGI